MARAAREQGQTWSLDAYYFNVIGQTRSSEDEQEYVPLDEIAKQREANPIASLYGSGLGLASKLFVSDAVPETPTEGQEIRSVRKDVDAEPSWTTALLDEDALAEWSGRARANKQRTKVEREIRKLHGNRRKASGDEADDIQAQIEALEKDAADLEEAAKSGVSIKAIFSFIAMPAGTNMRHKLRGRGLTPEELGALLVGIDGLSLDPVVGGQQARGCGGIKAEYEVKVRESGREPFGAVGSVSIGDFDNAQWHFTDDAAGAEFQQARQAFDQIVKSAGKMEWRALSDVA